jgi:hypothetical protein
MTPPDIRSEFCHGIAVMTGGGSGIGRGNAVRAYLLSDRGAYVTGDVLVVDGGQWLGEAICTHPTKGA